MNGPDFVSAVQQMSQWIGTHHVSVDEQTLARYSENTAGLERQIVALAKPCSTSEVQAVVRIANQFSTPLYPVSKGRNWGYGSRLPVRDGAIIVDLSRMNRIRNQISIEDHFAVIEPGVTQDDLHQAIKSKGLPLLLNATAAGKETSVLGNSLDRGFGYLAMRPDDISGLEVVLGSGEILQTGYGHYENATTTANYKFGLGPMLDGLFFQSNFGIVTSACVHLHPKRECHETMIIRLPKDEDFPRFIDILASLRRESVFESVLHIGSADRARVTLSPIIYRFLLTNGMTAGEELRRKAESLVQGLKPAAWTGVGGIFGTTDEVRTKVREIAKRLAPIATIETITEETFAAAATSQLSLEERAILEGAKTLADFSSCTPNDGALLSPLWALGLSPEEAGNLDHTPLGILFCCPSLSLNGIAAKEVVETTRRVFARFGFTVFMTLNIVNTKAMLCVLNLVFDKRDPQQAAKAHSCVDTLFEEWASLGVYPYRLGIQSMDQFVKASDPYWQLVKAMKAIFDPNEIIAPGRYNLS
jgi:4-cresol dehydrogenase (hydroxylating) flavoprotein subunit